MRRLQAHARAQPLMWTPSYKEEMATAVSGQRAHVEFVTAVYNFSAVLTSAIDPKFARLGCNGDSKDIVHVVELQPARLADGTTTALFTYGADATDNCRFPHAHQPGEVLPDGRVVVSCEWSDDAGQWKTVFRDGSTSLDPARGFPRVPITSTSSLLASSRPPPSPPPPRPPRDPGGSR